MEGVGSTFGKSGSGRGRRAAFGKLRKTCEDFVNIGRREIFCEAGRCTELLQDCVKWWQ